MPPTTSAGTTGLSFFAELGKGVILAGSRRDTRSSPPALPTSRPTSWTNLNSAQLRFLDLLLNHIAKYGSIEVARLYEAPFTTVHTDSLDGLFPD